ncbi:hypothetical protein [Noviherbaspirillum sp.]|uniref:hypothetical protein n=1 Tax=Noviherbaspirillum sp. TaxID=1926288 RepID=UPI002FE30386
MEPGKEYPSFQLYRHGVPVSMIGSPIDALERIGDQHLLQEYARLIAEDSDNPEP